MIDDDDGKDLYVEKKKDIALMLNKRMETNESFSNPLRQNVIPSLLVMLYLLALASSRMLYIIRKQSENGQT